MVSSNKQINFFYSKTTSKNVRIIIGIDSIFNLDKFLKNFYADMIFIICDDNVANLYAKKIQKIIKRLPVYLVTHSPNEKSKNLKTAKKIMDIIIKEGGSENSIICSLGGGVTGNIAGFVSSVLFRGLTLIHIPTTLLAQLDSAPDVKQSLNTILIKNGIGSYKAPDLVLIDPQFMISLSERDIRSGYAEAIKHAFAQDLDFIKFIASLFKNNDYINLNYLEKVIIKTISLKIYHWKNVPTMWNDMGKVERLTHLGHTIGKVLEIIDLGYLTHGEAIAHGMVIEFYISFKLGYLDIAKVKKAQEIMNDMGLLFPLSKKYTQNKIMKLLYSSSSDKEPLVALLQDFGNPDTISLHLPRAITKEALKWYFSL
ncbi:MAG: iron-containing alcohol dehydrogenase [Candidatus Daviesbacteria bacterium]|nr:MAG: iron-containing alcohol dehydrogenase [Candidatus Daviesbacteria bacterium]